MILFRLYGRKDLHSGMDIPVEYYISSRSYLRFERQDALAAQLTAASLSRTLAALRCWLHTVITGKLNTGTVSWIVSIQVFLLLITCRYPHRHVGSSSHQGFLLWRYV